MPLNKKKKGKDKKTKKQSSGEGRYHWEKWAAGGREDKAFPKPWVKCDHGTDATLIPSSSNHPVAKLMNSFEDEIELSPNGYTIRSLVGAAFYGNEEVWDNELLRKHTIDLFVRIGTNMCNARNSPANTRLFAAIVVVLENYTGDINETFIAVDGKVRDLTGGDDNCVSRDVVRFFRKRIPCKCLDQRYSCAKETPKLGECKTCEKQMERSHLQLCSKCKVAQYCCRDCQVKDWPVHKMDCLVGQVVRDKSRENPFKGMFNAMIPVPDRDNYLPRRK